jgi:hypothetical protein
MRSGVQVLQKEGQHSKQMFFLQVSIVKVAKTAL